MRKLKIVLQYLPLHIEILSLRLIKRYYSLSIGTPAKKDKIMVILPSKKGNLGDEAMINSLLSNIKEDVIIYNHENNNPYDFIIRNHKFVKDLRECKRSFLIGADMMDGYYNSKESIKLILLESIARNFTKSLIISTSFNSNPNKDVVREIRRNRPKIIARDSESYRRFKDLGITVKEGMDISFLLKNKKTNLTKSLELKIKELKKRGKIIIGLNPNFLILHNKKKTIYLYAKLIEELSKRDERLGFILLPHEYRGEDNDHILCNEIYNFLDSKIREKCIKIEDKLTSLEVREIVSHLDLVFTARMHLSIACLSQAIPVLALDYQDKFKGLMSYFGLQKNLMIKDDLQKTEKLSNFILSQIKIRNQTKDSIKKKIPKAIKLAKINLE